MKTVFFDVDTQIDFLFPAGALYVPGAERLLPAFAQLNRYAAVHGIPLVSTTDAHAENDPEFRTWPPHCVAGTAGQAKPATTLLDIRTVIPDRPVRVKTAAPQIVLEKRVLDPFSNPNMPTLLAALGADEYVVYGVVTEYCVRAAALGLAATGRPVTLVTDAIQALDQAACDRTFREFAGRGGRLASVSQVCAR